MNRDKSDLMKYVGTILKSTRLSLKLTLRDASSAAGISHSQLSNFETGSLNNIGLFDYLAVSDVYQTEDIPSALKSIIDTWTDPTSKLTKEIFESTVLEILTKVPNISTERATYIAEVSIEYLNYLIHKEIAQSDK